MGDFKILYIINVLVSAIIAIVIAPFYWNLGDAQVAFFATPYGKMAKFLLVTFASVTLIGLILPTFAAYDETEQQLQQFLKSKGLVGAPSFRSV